MTDDRETRTRVLAAATRLFSDQGYRKVTIREICRAARANVAAVNYHFGDKLALYRDVLQQAIDGMVRTNESARAAGEGRSPEDKLRRFLAIFLGQVVRPEHAMLHRLVQRELQDPTPVLDALVEQGIRPRLQYLAGVVADMTGGAPTDAAVLQCVGSINAQAIIYMPNPIATRLGYEFTGSPAEVESAVDHIVAFSLAGVRAAARVRRSSPSAPRRSPSSAPSSARRSSSSRRRPSRR